MTKQKPELKEYIVYGKITFQGATMVVQARDADEAASLAADLEGEDGWDTSCAELVDWSVTGVDENR